MVRALAILIVLAWLGTNLVSAVFGEGPRARRAVDVGLTGLHGAGAQRGRILGGDMEWLLGDLEGVLASLREGGHERIVLAVPLSGTNPIISSTYYGAWPTRVVVVDPAGRGTRQLRAEARSLEASALIELRLPEGWRVSLVRPEEAEGVVSEEDA